MNFDIKNLHKSRLFHGILIGIISLMIVLISFQAGIFVGYHRADFAYRSNENFYRTFGENGRGDMRNGTGSPEFMGTVLKGFDTEDLPGGHGSVGKIVRVSSTTIIIADVKNVEKTVRIMDDTLVRRLRDTIRAQDIAIGDSVIVIGDPDAQGEITAHLIRVLPPPSTAPVPASTSIPSATTTR
jgi:hypothetical protein